MKRDEQLRRRRPAQRVYLLAAFALTILLGLSDDILAQSQWTTNGNNINNTNTGNVGIGTTNPQSKLDVNGGVAIGSYSGVNAAPSNGIIVSGNVGIGTNSPLGILHAKSPASTHASFFLDTTSAGYASYFAFSEAGQGRASIMHNPSLLAGGLLFQTGGLASPAYTRMAINSAGNVGIGTTSPGHLLSLQKAASFTGTTALSPTNGLLDLYNSQSAAIGEGAMMVFSADYLDGGVSTKTSRAAIKGGSQFVNDNRGGFLAFYVNGTAVTNSLYERMRINSAGNVGIGTTSPETLLHLQSSDVSGSAGILLDDTAGHKYGWFSGGSGHGAIPNTLAVYDYTASAYRLAIDANGNVGIGTTSPTTRLDVAGQIRSSTGGFKFPDGTVQTTAAVSGGGTITGVTAGSGMTGGGTSGPVTLTNADPGSSQSIFKNIANAAGAPQFSAGSNNDTLRFEGSGGTSVTFDAASRKVIINSSPSSSTISAANVSAGQFGQNTGGGDFSFPANVVVAGNITAKYQDVAEWVPSRQKLAAGTVVVLDPEQSNNVMASASAYDTRAAGVVSAAPGVILGEGGEGKVMVATTGRVRVKVDATRAAIRIGDLLVTSDMPGVAMKSEPINIGGVQLHRPGTLIGKALEPLAKGDGEILVLLSLQ
jgi:hypothetical protein